MSEEGYAGGVGGAGDAGGVSGADGADGARGASGADGAYGAGGLRVEGLGVALPDGRGGHETVLEQVDVEVRPGELVVLLGPSGAGKSTLVAALLGLLPAGALVRGGAWWDDWATGGTDLLDPDPGVRERIRGRLAAWLPQAPASALTPVLTVGHHLEETARVHVPAADVEPTVDAALARHDVDQSWRRRLPSQLSGGQAQRVSNALALIGDPGLVLADEPTTGLDRPRADAAAAGLAEMAHDEGRAVLVVTHDLRIAEQVADRVIELDGGRTRQEPAPVHEVVERARGASHHLAPHRRVADRLHVVTEAPERPRAPGRPGPKAAGLTAVQVTLRRGRGVVVAEDATLEVPPDRTTGLMAPSGAGKTTMLRTLALLHPPAAGQVVLEGVPVRGTGHEVPAALRRRIAYVPQDPRQAVDPRWTLGRSLAEPRRLAGEPVDDTVLAQLLDGVGLPPGLAARRPDEVSGGQLQRVVLARALSLGSDYLLLDEPTSMVDAATARAVVRAVHEHQHATGCGVLVASHDEELLRTWCDRVVEW